VVSIHATQVAERDAPQAQEMGCEVKIFLLDVDGVLADFGRAYHRDLCKVTGVEHRFEDWDQWDARVAFGHSRKHDEELYDEHIRKPGWCASLVIYPGAQDFVKELHKLVDRVVFVTSPMRGPYWHFEREGWLREHFAAGSRDLIFAGDKTNVFGDFLLDDKLDTIQKWNAFWGPRTNESVTPILWSNAHNRRDDWPLKTGSWDDVLNMVREEA
jgi:5'(3')-deoxyribonucleotidase